MRILIIEDCIDYAKKMQVALRDLGEIKICTMRRVEYDEDDYEYEFPKMETVIEEIQLADIILLDYDLSTYYTGEDLQIHCKSKHVIGTSTLKSLGLIQFFAKDCLHLEHVAEKLREIVKKFIA